MNLINLIFEASVPVVIAWTILGYFLFLTSTAIATGEITLEDIVIAMVGMIFGPFCLVFIIMAIGLRFLAGDRLHVVCRIPWLSKS